MDFRSAKIRLFLVVGLIGLFAAVAWAQAPGGRYATVLALAKPAAVRPGGHTVVAVTITVAPGFHINSVKPADSYLIPTRLQMSKATGFVYGPIGYPANKTVKESYSPKPMLVYMGTAVIKVPVTAARTLKPGRYTLIGAVTYQGCNHSSCFPPMTAPISVPVTVK